MGKIFAVFPRGCYVYLEQQEIAVMDKVIDLLLQNKSMSTKALVKQSGYTSHCVRLALWRLIAKRPALVIVKQFARNRIYYLSPVMKKRIKQKQEVMP